MWLQKGYRLIIFFSLAFYIVIKCFNFSATHFFLLNFRLWAKILRLQFLIFSLSFSFFYLLFTCLLFWATSTTNLDRLLLTYCNGFSCWSRIKFYLLFLFPLFFYFLIFKMTNSRLKQIVALSSLTKIAKIY